MGEWAPWWNLIKHIEDKYIRSKPEEVELGIDGIMNGNKDFVKQLTDHLVTCLSKQQICWLGKYQTKLPMIKK